VSDWMPIETAPKDVPILAYEPYEWGGGAVVTIYWQPNVNYVAGGYWGGGSPLRVYEPTHWMPLPEPPLTARDVR